MTTDDFADAPTTATEAAASSAVDVDDLVAEVSGAARAHLGSLGAARVLRRPESDATVARHAREAGYDVAKGAVSAWQATVRANREAEHLHFPMQEPRQMPSTDSIAGTVATAKKRTTTAATTTDLERRVREVLEQSGVSDADISRYEAKLREEQRNPLASQDDAAAAVTASSQQGVSAGMGMKLYYQQLKAARRNKIKSKSFRRLERARKAEVRAAAMEELREADPESFQREEERKEKQRVLERATLKHRRDSKWAKQQRLKGLAKDPEVRAMLAENTRKGRELARKMESVSGDLLPEQTTAADGDGDAVDEDAMGAEGETQRNPRRDDYDDVEHAEEAAAEIAREEAAAMTPETALDATTADAAATTAAPPSFSGSSAVIDAAGITRGRRAKVSGNITVTGVPAMQVEQPLFQEPSFETPATTPSSSKHRSSRVVFQDVSADDASAVAPSPSSSSSNPWLAPTTAKPAVTAATEAPIVDMTHDSDGEDDNGTVHGALTDSADPQQRQLVREAFAADDSDLERDFDTEKNAEVEEAVGTAAQAKLTGARLPGWGQWAGDGVVETPRAKARREREEKKKEDEHKKKMEQKRAIRRDVAMRHVIINERVDKKLAPFQVHSLPSGVTPQHHERMIAMPVGKEWQPVSTHNRAIQPAVVVERGAILQPLSKRDLKQPRRKREKAFGAPATKRPHY